MPLWERAVWVAIEAGIKNIAVTTDTPERLDYLRQKPPADVVLHRVHRPAELAQDDTPMQPVVAHTLELITGPPGEIILLLQPTQPLRQSRHIEAALQLLEHYYAEGCIISVTQTESVDRVCFLDGWKYLKEDGPIIERRQEARPTFKRDGTVYAWRRRDGLYHRPWIVLNIPPEETCPLDTELDWKIAEWRVNDVKS